MCVVNNYYTKVRESLHTIGYSQFFHVQFVLIGKPIKRKDTERKWQ